MGGQRPGRPLFPVHKPELHAVYDHQTDGIAYRAELTAYTSSPVLSPDPVLSAELDLAPEFLEQLHADVRTVNQAVTDRVAVRQQWIDRVVPLMTSQEAPQIRTWQCAHGDFHPANLTQDGTILDWEGFGMAPAGYDAATLYAYSLTAPKTAARIFEEFKILDSPDGRQALLVVATELLQAASRGAHPHLVPDLVALARRCT
ncbi:phosphotransferase [Actinacidiphila sp. DG2A-62]|uniref:phosphotransferase n=1 Tax=Actinacidiphila sp. DG2A-62 TaxID=3108821 RepID=UPI002DB7D4B7|nr:phosphotransferase [Actinacidiphila sp. DG2A-62]MEC3995036.1 phosphotransferase [Actinacidiphila sp. DG2A-62]